MGSGGEFGIGPHIRTRDDDGLRLFGAGGWRRFERNGSSASRPSPGRFSVAAPHQSGATLSIASATGALDPAPAPLRPLSQPPPTGAHALRRKAACGRVGSYPSRSHHQGVDMALAIRRTQTPAEPSTRWDPFGEQDRARVGHRGRAPRRQARRWRPDRSRPQAGGLEAASDTGHR